jgi:hypothetical protein
VAARQRRTRTVADAARIPVATTEARMRTRSDAVPLSVTAKRLSGVGGEQSGHGSGVTSMKPSCRRIDAA